MTVTSQMSILTVGLIAGWGMRFNFPIAIVPLRHTDNGYWIFQPPAAYSGRRADVAHPRPGSFGPHGRRIDFIAKWLRRCALTMTHVILSYAEANRWSKALLMLLHQLHHLMLV